MRWAWVPIVLVATLWAAGGTVYAQERGNTEIKVTAYTEIGPNGPSLGEITIGDPVTIAIEVAHPPDTQVVFPRIDNQWDDVFELKGSPRVSSEKADGRLVTTKTFEVVAFKTGEHETPPIIVTILSPGSPPLDQSAGLLKLDVVPVTEESAATVNGVATPRPLVDGELVPPRPPVEMREPLLDLEDLAAPSSWPWIVASLSLIGLAVWGLYVLLRPRPPEPVFIHPYDAAMAELKRIEGLRLPASGRFKEHYTLVADVVRTYLEGEFGIPALDRTSSEIVAEVTAADIDDDGAIEMRWLFVDCDIVKFTGLEPGEYEAGLMAGRAREILDMIRPPETPAEPEGGGQLAEAAGA
jgi:hypothetical protein